MSLIAIAILLFEAASTFVLGGTLGKPPLQYNATVIGGYNASIENFPYQVSIHYKYYKGGGSIISESYVLTHVLCINEAEIEDTFIHAGSTFLHNGTVIPVAAFIIQEHSPETLVALLKTKDPIKFTPVIKPIKLPPKNRPLKDGSTIIVSGWGGHINLQAIDLPVVNFDVCKTIFVLNEFEFCAGGSPSGGKGMCLGDNGNVAVQDDIQVGIFGKTYPCVHRYMPDVYIDIAHPIVRDFITKHTGL